MQSERLSSESAVCWSVQLVGEFPAGLRRSNFRRNDVKPVASKDRISLVLSKFPQDKWSGESRETAWRSPSAHRNARAQNMPGFKSNEMLFTSVHTPSLMKVVRVSAAHLPTSLQAGARRHGPACDRWAAAPAALAREPPQPPRYFTPVRTHRAEYKIRAQCHPFSGLMHSAGEL